MGSSRSRRSPRALAAAVEAFLDALALPDEVRRRPDLAATPQRVADAWANDLLDGYRCSPRTILRDSMRASSQDLVAVTAIDYHSMCPHHLLPSRGVAHVAYVPGERVVGFGQVARLVDCLAHRLVLAEDLAREIASSLEEHLGARGAACVLDAEHFCLSIRGERRRDARAHAQCFVGALAEDARLQDRFLALFCSSGGATPGASRMRERRR